jgi:hypothetical protein
VAGEEFGTQALDAQGLLTDTGLARAERRRAVHRTCATTAISITCRIAPATT